MLTLYYMYTYKPDRYTESSRLHYIARSYVSGFRWDLDPKLDSDSRPGKVLCLSSLSRQKRDAAFYTTLRSIEEN